MSTGTLDADLDAVILDETILDEVPPCGVETEEGVCGVQAEWISRGSCGCIVLMCEEHRQLILFYVRRGHGMVCNMTHPGVSVTITWLPL